MNLMNLMRVLKINKLEGKIYHQTLIILIKFIKVESTTKQV